MSVATAWEIATKYRLGKLPEAEAMAYDNVSVIALQGFGEMPVSVEHGDRAGSLPGLHRDPFDRMLIALRLWSAIRCSFLTNRCFINTVFAGFGETEAATQRVKLLRRR